MWNPLSETGYFDHCSQWLTHTHMCRGVSYFNAKILTMDNMLGECYTPGIMGNTSCVNFEKSMIIVTTTKAYMLSPSSTFQKSLARLSCYYFVSLWCLDIIELVLVLNVWKSEAATNNSSDYSLSFIIKSENHGYNVNYLLSHKIFFLTRLLLNFIKHFQMLPSVTVLLLFSIS